jgi:NADH:ubiquinone oxidoreductase subunit F (NADH-binding)
VTQPEQSACLVCRAFDTAPGAHTRADRLRDGLEAVLEAVRALAQAEGAVKAYVCVAAGQAAPVGTGVAASAGSVDVEVVPVIPRLVLEDDTALLRVLQGRQAIPYLLVPASAPLTMLGRPAVVRNLETLLPEPAAAARWPAGVLETVSPGMCAVAFTGEVMGALSAESCGACVVCREGTRQAADILAYLAGAAGAPGAGDEQVRLLEELAAALEAGSICHVGAGAATLLRGSFDLFAADYQAHAAGAPCLKAQPDA